MTRTRPLSRSRFPVSTSVTCAVPQVCLTRATHDRILRASVTESSTASSSFRHQSQAPHDARRVRLAEVLDQGAMTAARAGGVALHVAQQRARALAPLAVVLEHLPPAHEVAARINQDALGRRGRRVPRVPIPADSVPAIAARPACTTKRTFDRSMPMPNATVATTMSTRSSRNISWCRLRTASDSPA